MKIHECAAIGDISGVAKAIEAGCSVDAYNTDGLTPLMLAARSPRATPETLQALINLGADVNALALPISAPQLDENAITVLKEMGIDTSFMTLHPKPPAVDSVLTYAVKHASLEKISVLLAAGADVAYVDPCGNSVLQSALLREFAEPKAASLELVGLLIRAGAPLDVKTAYNESAVTSAAFDANLPLLRLLLDAGANPKPLGWNELFFAVAFDDARQVGALATDRDELRTTDCWGRTPFLLAVHAGFLDKAAVLLNAGSDLSAQGRCEQTALTYAIWRQDSTMVRWLIEQGADIEEADQFGIVPLMRACQSGSADCVRELLAAEADVTCCDKQDQGVMHYASSPEIIDLLSDSILSWDEIGVEMRKALVGHEGETLANASLAEFSQYQNRTFGRSNPERMNNPFWEAMVRSRADAYFASVELGETTICREPCWCFDRFGHSLTKLPDGRYVEIGGEHEDYYDPDFCIYNDVVVHHGDGTFDIFGYPEEIFPPTDFHSATLVGSHIYIIGSLGHTGKRQAGDTPVYRLDTTTFSIERINCTGTSPGWIHRHKARLCDGGEIAITDGLVFQDDDLVPNTNVFRLDVAKGVWRSV